MKGEGRVECGVDVVIKCGFVCFCDVCEFIFFCLCVLCVDMDLG